MKKVLSKIDWFQVGVISLGLVASLSKSIYDAKKFDSVIEKQLDEGLEKKVQEIVKKELKKRK